MPVAGLDTKRLRGLRGVQECRQQAFLPGPHIQVHNEMEYHAHHPAHHRLCSQRSRACVRMEGYHGHSHLLSGETAEFMRPLLHMSVCLHGLDTED